jgi:DNA-binding MarR family transcriptional regulator
VESDANPEDGRSRLLRLSVSGKQLVRRLKPLWRTLNATSLELDKEAGGVVAALDRLDRALERSPLYDRVTQKLAARKPRIRAL